MNLVNVRYFCAMYDVIFWPIQLHISVVCILWAEGSIAISHQCEFSASFGQCMFWLSNGLDSQTHESGSLIIHTLHNLCDDL